MALSSGLLAGNQLTVRCLDEAGSPIKDLKLSIQGVRGNEFKEKKTNKQGLAVFKNLSTDLFRAWARPEGYQPGLYEFVHLTEGSNETIELRFTPGEDRPLYFEDPALSQQAAQLVNEGIQAISDKDLDKAIEQLEAAIALNPSTIDGHHHLGMAYLDKQRFDEARTELETEVRFLKLYLLAGVDPDAVTQRIDQVENVLGFVPILMLQAEAQQAFAQNDYPTAVVKLKEIARAQPDNASVYLNLATAQFQARQFDDSMASINRGLELEPDNKALADLKAAVAQGVRGLLIQQSREKLAKIAEHFNNKDYQKFVDEARAIQGEIVEELQPALWLDMARALVQIQQVDEAVSAYRKSIELAPDRAELQKELADYLLQQERVPDAIEAYVSYFSKSPESATDNLFKLGLQFGQQGKDEIAIQFYDRVLEIDKDYPEAYYSLGMYYYFGQDHMKAETLLKRYLELGKDADHVNNTESVLAVIAHAKSR
jgi:tetratricopeptide (TPR) repeat protein